MAGTDVRRKPRFTARWNWNEKDDTRGYISIQGEGFANSVITINYKYYDPDSTAESHTNVSKYGSSVVWNNGEDGATETIILT